MKVEYISSSPKVFCIGLHKTGTSSLAHVLRAMGFRTLHRPWWSKPPIPNEALYEYDAFTDGGGHFWFEDREFGSNHEVALLDRHFPGSKYICTTRNMTKWLISKMKHAGWNRNVVLQPAKDVTHDEWTYKSIDVIRKWIINHDRYHKKVFEYFAERPQDLLTLDFTSDDCAIEKIAGFLSVPVPDINKPHAHRNDAPEEDQEFYSRCVEEAFATLAQEPCHPIQENAGKLV